MSRAWVTHGSLPSDFAHLPSGPPVVNGYREGAFCADCAARPVSRKCEGCPALAYAGREFERWAEVLGLEVKKPRRRLRRKGTTR